MPPFLDPESGRGYGYLPDLAGQATTYRAWKGAAYAEATAARAFLPHVPARITDQGPIGSCVGCTVADAKEALDLAEGINVEWSKRYGYLGGRLALNGLSLAEYVARPGLVRPKMLADTGCMISDVVRFVTVEGLPSEAVDPYYTDQRFADLPSARARAQAQRNRVLDSVEIGNSGTARAALAAADPVLLGFTVPLNLHVAGQTGCLAVPTGYERSGHAVWAVGYDDEKACPGWGSRGALLLRNSWGTDWGTDDPRFVGLRGHFWMPYAFFDSDKVSDCFALVEVRKP